MTNFAFVPAYDNGAAPVRHLDGRDALHHVAQWRNGEDFDYDAGFAVMRENTSGQSLTGVVGSYPIAFNLARGGTFKAYGYPAAKPFNGQTLWSCSGAVVQDTFGGSQDQGLACNMTGGSSGGGWINGSSLNSVTSFGYTGLEEHAVRPVLRFAPSRRSTRAPRPARPRQPPPSLADHSSARRA